MASIEDKDIPSYHRVYCINLGILTSYDWWSCFWKKTKKV